MSATVRKMLPSKRNDRPEFEISLDGVVIGWLKEHPYRGDSFWGAIGIHRPTGERVDLELSKDFEGRVETLVTFWNDPMSSKQHLPQRLIDASETEVDGVG